MTDLYHEIYTGEIFQTSQCIWHENNLLDFVRSNLISLGYQSADSNNKVWRRGNQTVVVCLVDDFTTCSEDYSLAVPYLFDTNTVVITDNCVNVPTQYRVCQLPASFYGIYAHTPAVNTWQPNRRFCFAVNRMDHKRMLMFLEMRLRVQFRLDGEIDNRFNIDVMDYTNFNCWSWNGDNTSVAGLRENFDQQYQELEPPYCEVYKKPYQHVRDAMPYRNHDLSQEQAHVSAWMNIVMETYSSDTTVALSEKTFRALCLPVPWMLYSGKHTVAYLNSLGFDVMSDVISHRYDSMIENRTAAYGDKMVDFLFEATDTVKQIQANSPRSRAQQAAEHNQQLLKQMRQQWPQDFAQWWPATVELIK
jgi:hypothetical protein